ncbi:MAG: sugar phosphate isomerase/epimerase [Clostridia bacterium]|nr:sugar phosphate isomerase/epimerase [Clostridia bacterium]
MNLPIAIQLFSLRNTFPNDIEGTLQALKDMGYDGVEFAGFHGRSARELREICERIGIIPISVHITYPELCEKIDERIEEYSELGCKYVAIASMHREFHKGGEKHEGVYENIKKMSKRFRDRGMTLVYHNHGYEMCEYEGKRLHEWLFENMTEEELQPEIDTGWIELEVGEAERYIRKFKGRCDLVHVKSYYGHEGYDELVHSPDEIKPRHMYDFCNYEVGRLDVPAIARAAVESGAKWLIVEQDRPEPDHTELDSARININVLRSL